MISVGIDVSKGKSTVSIMKPGGEVLAAPFDVLHCIDPPNALAKRIKSYDEEVRVVLESTGHYHYPVVTQLVEHGIFVTCVNSLRMKKYCSQSIRRAKTDKIDSLKIASYGLTYWNELVQIKPSGEIYDELRNLSRQYYQFVGLLVKTKVNFSNLLDKVMPNIQTQLSQDKLFDFVNQYIHYENIVKLGEKRFVSDYCKWAKRKGYHSNERKAIDIFALSQNSIPVISNTPSTKIAVVETVRILQELEKSRDTILTQMIELAKTLPEFSLLIEQKGIGKNLACKLIAEIGDVRRFHSRNALIAYAGIDAPPYQSGNFYGNNRHISKRGNKYLRKTGFEIMQSFIKHKPENDAVYQFIQQKRGEGKAYKVAMVAGFNKFLRIYYARVCELYVELDGLLGF